MKLFIVESPNKCAKIKSFLGPEYVVTASVGHIREIPKKGVNIDIKNGFEPKYEISSDKKDVVKKIKEEAEKADKIYLATDPDREGSAIAWSIYEILNEKCKKKCSRVMFNEINKNAILNAIKEETKIEEHMPTIQAAKARQVLDRLIGYGVSPVLWYSAHIAGSSAGRVQSIALKIVCDRQKEVDAFKPEDYWFVEALLKCKKGEFWAKVVTKEKENKYLNEKIAQDDLEKLKKASFVLDKVERAEKKNNAPAPFDTNSLQVTCSSLFGWSLSKSQAIAQKLYEQGKVTYIRSDSFNISAEALKEVRDYLKETESGCYIPSSANVYTKKSSAAAQEAHECIRPTHVKENGDDLDDDSEKKMYKLIRDRFIACQMTPQIVDTVCYDVKASTGHHLIARGQTIKFDGWSKVYKYSKTKEEVLPEASEKESLDLKDIKKTKHTTQPPARYNEGSLAKAMEKEGVGRPSTRASIITSIQKKGYVEKEKKGKGLIATILGMRICDYLQPNFKDFFMDIKYTSALEEDLDEIAKGKKGYLDVVQSTYDVLQKEIKKTKENTPKSLDVITGEKCTICEKGSIVQRHGKFGDFFACDQYPDCHGIFTKGEDGKFTIKEKKVSNAEDTGKKCLKCQKGQIVKRNGEYGEFYSCNKYPSCKTIFVKDSDGNFVIKNKKSWDKKENKQSSESNEEKDSNNKEDIDL